MSVIESEKSKARYSAQRYLNSESLLSFNGIDQYINYGNVIDSTFDNEYSISLFFEIDKDQEGYIGADRPIINKQNGIEVNTPTSDGTFAVIYRGTGEVIFIKHLNSGANQFRLLTSNPIVFGVLNHLVILVKSDRIQLYINGVLEDEDVATAVFYNTDLPLRLGFRDIENTYFKGTIVNLTFFNKSLTQDEISFIHTWSGQIPESSMENIVLSQNLQYDNFEYIPIDMNY